MHKLSTSIPFSAEKADFMGIRDFVLENRDG